MWYFTSSLWGRYACSWLSDLGSNVGGPFDQRLQIQSINHTTVATTTILRSIVRKLDQSDLAFFASGRCEERVSRAIVFELLFWAFSNQLRCFLVMHFKMIIRGSQQILLCYRLPLQAWYIQPYLWFKYRLISPLGFFNNLRDTPISFISWSEGCKRGPPQREPSPLARDSLRHSHPQLETCNLFLLFLVHLLQLLLLDNNIVPCSWC